MDYLDIVFADRNKAYGAYALRSAYARHLQLAFAGMLTLVAGGIWSPDWHVLSPPLPALKLPSADTTVICTCLFPISGREMPAPVWRPAPPLPAGKRYWKSAKAVVSFPPPVVLEDTIVLEEPFFLPGERRPPVSPKTTVRPDSTRAGLSADTLPPTGSMVDTSLYYHALTDNPPIFPGGDMAMLAFLRENLRFPPLADTTHNITVVVTLVVDRYGDITDPAVVFNRGGPAHAEEALRVLRSMPCWQPAKRHGRPIPMRMTVPIKGKG